MEPSAPLETPASSATPALAFGIPAILILAALPFLQVGDGTSIPTFFLFVGRFHPTLLHLPVALLLLALLLELVRLPRLARFAPSFPSTVLDSVLWLAALSGFAAALAGWLLSSEGGYDALLLDRHLWSGVATAIGAFACVLARSFAKVRPDRAGLGRLATALVVITGGTMMFAAHAGGSLTHGEGYLTEYAPAPIRLLAGLPIPRDRSLEMRSPIAEREVFEGVALRIFESHCTSCHNPGKLKGELKLDTYEGVLAGGQSGPVVVAGDPGASELLQRVHLPLEDKAHMPPKGKTPLSDDETAVLTWWVEAGLPKDGTLKARKAPTEIRAAFTRTLPEGERRAVEELQKLQASEYETTLASLRAEVPGSLRAILPGERDLEYTAAIAGATFGDAQLQKLGSAGNDLLWLDLSRTGITDAGLKALAQMPNLEHLDLRGTAVGDEGVKALANLKNLHTLGLYGTRVTDAGLEALRALPSLRRLYVGGTKVTGPGLDALRKARPELQVTP
ncbi:MAG TPA: c-type cytochrome domain-containing protein [Vicinamibacteria bacterium]